MTKEIEDLAVRWGLDSETHRPVIEHLIDLANDLETSEHGWDNESELLCHLGFYVDKFIEESEKFLDSVKRIPANIHTTKFEYALKEMKYQLERAL